ncbi:MAG: DUF2071 domain-containing protein [Flavisolibacter sp.]
MYNLESKPFLSANWQYLAMFNFEVDPQVLQPHLPPFTELDLFQNKAIVSVVGFLFNDTRVMGIKWPGFVNFEEVNLRYYVKHYDGKDWKRGVGFISEIVPRNLVATLANFSYNEHYSTAQMNHKLSFDSSNIEIVYNWKKKNQLSNSIWVRAQNQLQDIVAGTAEEFIFEHYYGYNKLNASTTIEYSVKHPRWKIYIVGDFKLSCNVANLFGVEFEPFIQDKTPLSVFLAQGSEVLVNRPQRITLSKK